jgi:hypothetical protein
MLDSNDLETLSKLRTPSVNERAIKVLQVLSRRCPRIGDAFTFDFDAIDTQYPSWLAISWSQTGAEFQYLVCDYLRDHMRAVGGKLIETGGTSLLDAVITPAGFQVLEQLREVNPGSAIGFCAMWFDDDVLPLWTDGISLAIAAAGYDPKRIDQHEHTNKIDDEIVAMIRRSRFVVADFTGQRGGVYFEAGYALGLGLRVVWICRDDELSAVHFDTRQYNFLVWEKGEYADLAKRLQNRIEATLGRGPIRV